MARKLYPLGIQTFSEIRKNDNLYIDKTKYIYRMAKNDGKYFFLSRPRRFGKSLLLSTMQSYFEGRKDLFKGLAMEKLEKEWEEYPVLHFTMASGKHMEKEQLERYLLYILKKNEDRFDIENDSIDPNIRLSSLIETIYKKTGKQVVILIDEYDAPLLDVVHKDNELEVLRDTMRNFYSPLKDCEPYLRFVFLTGITKFSQLSIFSELNNITNISMQNDYAAICGITKEEMLTEMQAGIDELAQAQEMTKEEAIEELKHHYDGYHFTSDSPDIFNPFSLLHCLSEKEFNSYWFASGTPTYLINMLRKFEVLPTEIAPVEAAAREFDAPTETMQTIIPLLYQSGYITIKGYNKAYKYYTLDIPNNEVRVGLTNALIPAYVTRNTLMTSNTARRIAQALDKQDMDGALQLLKTFLGTVPYCDNTHYEGHYQQVLYIVFSLLTDYMVDVEIHTPNGRVDMMILTRTDLFILEFKLDQDAKAAMNQINIKDYRQRFALCGKPITKVGINFDSDKGNIEDWVIEK